MEEALPCLAPKLIVYLQKPLGVQLDTETFWSHRFGGSLFYIFVSSLKHDGSAPLAVEALPYHVILRY